MKLIVSMDWNGNTRRVGHLDVFSSRGSETYQFTYEPDWIKDGFQIDPELDLIEGQSFHMSTLAGCFQDAAPDRWGRLIQKRAHHGHLGEIDYQLGVSDFMRAGALRFSSDDTPDTYLSNHHSVPKLVDIRAFEEASRRVENGVETSDDLLQLLGPGSSLGGARPKAVIQDKGSLYIAKFMSRNDDERVPTWEAVMLDLASRAGITVPEHRLLNKNTQRPVLLVKRFDRVKESRIPFSSAMTLTGMVDGDEYNYADLAALMRGFSPHANSDSLELWRRMIFNAMTGNTDDHLRNHAFLRVGDGWQLSPAYDLNPNPLPIDKRRHTLAFVQGEYAPSLKVCMEVGQALSLPKPQMKNILKDVGSALGQWRDVAKQHGLSDSEIGRMSTAFDHKESQKLMSTSKTQHPDL